jgi:DNA-binding transcriptional LysR family regulator
MNLLALVSTEWTGTTDVAAMNPLSLPSLSVFVEVARHRSFTRAAAALGVSPTALSKSLQRLENSLGVRLLNRTTRAVQVTDEGAFLLDQISPAISAIGQALDSLNNADKEVRGTLRVTVPTVAYSLLLERHVADFLRRYPMLHLELLIDDALVDIVSVGLDAGIRLGERLALDMFATPLLRSERMAVVAAPSYLAGKPPIESPADLLAHECIRLRLKTTGTLYPWSLTIGGESRAVDVQGRLMLDNMPAVLNAAINGCGVACTFERLAASAIGDGRLRQLLPGSCQDYPGWYLYFPSRRHISARLRAFIDFFRSTNADTWERVPAQIIAKRSRPESQTRLIESGH